MRKIETQMIDAINDNINWSKDNTSVIFQDEVSNVYLHGKLIADVGVDFLKLFDGDHHS